MPATYKVMPAFVHRHQRSVVARCHPVPRNLPHCCASVRALTSGVDRVRGYSVLPTSASAAIRPVTIAPRSRNTIARINQREKNYAVHGGVGAMPWPVVGMSAVGAVRGGSPASQAPAHIAIAQLALCRHQPGAIQGRGGKAHREDPHHRDLRRRPPVQGRRGDRRGVVRRRRHGFPRQRSVRREDRGRQHPAAAVPVQFRSPGEGRAQPRPRDETADRQGDPRVNRQHVSSGGCPSGPR